MDVDPEAYRRFFLAFDTDVPQIAAVLAAAKRDRYWGIRIGASLAGVFMLRGLDEGYPTPAFGVYIAGAAAGRGLSQLALQFAIAWCRIAGHGELMLTVHQDHAAAIHVYEKYGFVFSGQLSSRGHRIYRKPL